MQKKERSSAEFTQKPDVLGQLHMWETVVLLAFPEKNRCDESKQSQEGNFIWGFKYIYYACIWKEETDVKMVSSPASFTFWITNSVLPPAGAEGCFLLQGCTSYGLVGCKFWCVAVYIAFVAKEEKQYKHSHWHLESYYSGVLQEQSGSSLWRWRSQVPCRHSSRRCWRIRRAKMVRAVTAVTAAAAAALQPRLPPAPAARVAPLRTSHLLSRRSPWIQRGPQRRRPVTSPSRHPETLSDIPLHKKRKRTAGSRHPTFF